MTDQKTVQRVVLLLGLIAIIGLVGLIGLVALERAPEAIAVVATVTGGAAGSLGTLLASTRSVDVEGLNQLAALQAGGGSDPAPSGDA